MTHCTDCTFVRCIGSHMDTLERRGCQCEETGPGRAVPQVVTKTADNDGSTSVPGEIAPGIAHAAQWRCVSFITGAMSARPTAARFSPRERVESSSHGLLTQILGM